jgi:hypothetical protein
MSELLSIPQDAQHGSQRCPPDPCSWPRCSRGYAAAPACGNAILATAPSSCWWGRLHSWRRTWLWRRMRCACCPCCCIRGQLGPPPGQLLIQRRPAAFWRNHVALACCGPWRAQLGISGGADIRWALGAAAGMAEALRGCRSFLKVLMPLCGSPVCSAYCCQMDGVLLPLQPSPPLPPPPGLLTPPNTSPQIPIQPVPPALHR